MIEQETVERKKFIRSDGLLVLLIAVGMAAVLGGVNYLSIQYQVNTQSFQMYLYVAMIVVCYLIYRNHIISYRYELTDTMFTVYRIVGRKEVAAEKVFLRDVEQILPFAEASGAKGREYNLSAAKKKKSTVVSYLLDGKRNWLIVSPSDAMLQKLQAQIEIAKMAPPPPEEVPETENPAETPSEE